MRNPFKKALYYMNVALSKMPFAFKMGGEAGFGITSAGLTFSKFAARSGYNVFDYLEYPSIIRGGHNAVACFIASDESPAVYHHTDFLVAFNQDTIALHLNELTENALVLYDSEAGVQIANLPGTVVALDVPFSRLAREVGKSFFVRDTIALSASIALLGGNIKILEKLLTEQFAHKGKEVVQKNLNVARSGYTYALEKYPQHVRPILQPRKKTKSLVINGNEAVALGAIAAGMQFAAIYPMTPTSSILSVLAPLQKQFDFIYKQPEDEISAINMAIGASFAGARSMVATAGGGFCLMTEGYGLAGMTETPIVIIEGMRGAPATGLPTWTEQGDLRFVLHAHQGDFPRIVLAPGDVEEVFHLTMEAFNLADQYQTPVVLLIDKHLCECHESVRPFEYKRYKVQRGKFARKKVSTYERYALSDDGVSLRIPAGSGTHVIANSDEHSEAGYSSETAENRNAQMRKRMQKLETCRTRSLPKPTVYGPDDADLTIVSWGSNKGAIREALKHFPRVNFLHITWMNPFPVDEVQAILRSAKKILSIEGNYTGQLTGLIAEHTGIHIENTLFKYDGRPIFPCEIVEKINSLL